MTTDKRSNPITPELQLLVYGDRNTFVFDATNEDKAKIASKKIAKLLHVLEQQGYAISNAHIMMDWSAAVVTKFKDQFFALIDASTKSGAVFRTTFAKSAALTAYTDEEWLAICAQYSLTYGWSNQFSSRIDRSAQDILASYVDTISEKTAKLSKGEVKLFAIADIPELQQILRSIVESPVVLRTQQLKTLEATPAYLLAQACSGANIRIKETLIKVMSLVAGEKLAKPLLQTATDVLRFVVATMAHTPIVGQINKTILKQAKIRIPSAMRKVLLAQLELIACRQKTADLGAKYLAEDMFVYAMFWKRLDKYLRYEKATKTRAKFPLYTKAIDLLYEGDRSWTFNGRYSVAKANYDYSLAITIASEQPGFLLRNVIEYLRMKKGVALPVKSGSKRSSENPFQNMLSQKDVAKPAVIRTDASQFFASDEFVTILNHRLNAKLAWQLLEKLKDKSLEKEMHRREVQGQVIHYSTPLPGVNKALTKLVRKQIIASLQFHLSERNKKIGSVYVDEDSRHYKLQYSGRSSTEISYAGEFLSAGSELVLSEVINQKSIDNPIVRLGIMWRAAENKEQSIDLDHNVSFNTGAHVYYGNPEYNRNGKLLAISSGDITTCGNYNSNFSVEIVDLNIGDLANVGVKYFYNSVINYTGREVSIGSLETYFFFTLLDKKNRITKKSKIKIDLSKADYAIRIDPDNIDNTGSYIGIQFDIENDRIKTLCIPIKHAHGGYSNVRAKNCDFTNAIANVTNQLTMAYALKKILPTAQWADQVSQASLVISRKPREDLALGESVVLLHPGRDAEAINKMLF